jgi:hypothetical protein
MIDRSHDLPLARQAALLRLSRSTLHYEPVPVPAVGLGIMRRIDELHLDHRASQYRTDRGAQTGTPAGLIAEQPYSARDDTAIP